MNNSIDPIQDSVKTVEEITPIWGSGAQPIYSDDDVREFVEEPLVDACKMFLDKGIRTYWSSANTDSGQKQADIGVDYSSLSEENKAIASKLGGIVEDNFDLGGNFTFKGVVFLLPISAKTPVADITQWSIGIAEKFKTQVSTWVPKYTLEEINRIQIKHKMPPIRGEDIYAKIGLFYAPDGYIYSNEKAYQYHIKHRCI